MGKLQQCIKIINKEMALTWIFQIICWSSAVNYTFLALWPVFSKSDCLIDLIDQIYKVVKKWLHTAEGTISQCLFFMTQSQGTQKLLCEHKEHSYVLNAKTEKKKIVFPSITLHKNDKKNKFFFHFQFLYTLKLHFYNSPFRSSKMNELEDFFSL